MKRAPCRPLLLTIAFTLVAGPLVSGASAQSIVKDETRGGLRAEPPLFSEFEMERLIELLDEHIEEPEALLHLVELRRWMSDVTDLSAMRGAFAKVALDRRAHPEVRAYARWLAARTEWRRGRMPRAKEWMGQLGFLQDTWIAGPFDNEGGAGVDMVWPPEAEELEGRPPSKDAVYDGKEGPVSWRAVPDVFPLGYVDLTHLVDPRREVVVYLRAAVESEREKPAALRMGTPGPTKVWLNGQEAFSSRADHPARFDQHAVPLNLKRGENVLFMKLTQRQGGLGFYLRLTDVTGAPLTGVETLPADTPRKDAVDDADPPAVDTVLGDLMEAAEDDPEDARAIAVKARALSMRHPFDRADREHLEVAKKALAVGLEHGASVSEEETEADEEDRRAHLLSELYHLVAGFENDHNRRRHALEASLDHEPKNLSARLDLGFHHLGRGDARLALPHLEEVVRRRPGYVQAALSLTDARTQVGFPEEERRAVAALSANHPRSPSVISREASLALDEGRSDRAAARLRVGVGLYPGDRGLRGMLVSSLLDLGRLDEAVETMRQGLRFEPSSIYDRLRLADLLSANRRGEKAVALFEEAAAQNPDMADVHYRHALHHLRHGFRPAAREHLERAFARRPQDPRISELRSLLAEEEEDFARPYLVDATELAREARETEEAKGEDVVTLSEVTAVRVHPSGLSTRVHQEVHHISSRRGVERMRTRSVSYTPGDQILRVEQARVIRPDGSVLQARTERERSLSAPWARLYFDQRARVLSFPELSPGDVVELVWRREDVSFVNMFGDYFGDLALFQSRSPIDQRSYVLLAPADRELYYNEIDLPDVRHTEELREDGMRVLSWTAEDIDKIVPEVGMPGWTEIAPFLHVSTHESWRDVAGWWWRLIEEQLRPTSELAAVARDLVEGIPEEDVHARVAAIHNYVVRRTRYVGLEFGIHGYKPYRVGQIHERRFGDCKDTAALMHSLLDAVGIESRMVILRMRRLGRIPDYPASLAVFNHAILYVPKIDLWLDGTAEFAGTRELPSQDQDAAILVVEHDDLDSSWFGYAPVPKAEDNVSRTDLSVVLEPDGSATGTGTFEVRGSAAPSYRRAYQASDKRRQKYEQELARNYPGVRVEELRMSGLDELEKPVTTAFSVSLPGFARGDESRLAFRPLGDGRGYAERFAALSSRRHDLILAFPFTTRQRLSVVVPDGWSVVELPEPERMESEHGSIALDYRTEGRKIVVELEVSLKSSRVPASDYAEFRELLGRFDRLLSREIRMAPAQATLSR